MKSTAPETIPSTTPSTSPSLPSLFLIIAICLAGAVSTQAVAEPQLIRIPQMSKATQLERDYYLYLPANFEQQDSWPVLLFLHGNGERGDGKEELEYVMSHGPLFEAWVQKRDLPFVMIAPQLPMFGQENVPYIKNRSAENIPRRLAQGVPARNPKFAALGKMDGIPRRDGAQLGPGGPPGGWQLLEEDLLGMVDTVLREYKGDKNRVYITGLSMGGFGTWYMVSKHPEIFAAANPIVGYGHPDLAATIAQHKIPLWCFAGGRDPVVPVAFFYDALNKLEELGHPDVRFTVEQDMSHDVWTRVYAGEDIYNWLLAQAK